MNIGHPSLFARKFDVRCRSMLGKLYRKFYPKFSKSSYEILCFFNVHRKCISRLFINYCCELSLFEGYLSSVNLIGSGQETRNPKKSIPKSLEPRLLTYKCIFTRDLLQFNPNLYETIDFEGIGFTI